MMYRFFGLFLLSIVILESACVEEDVFGLSPYGRIKVIEVTNQASAAVISNDSLTVTIEFPAGVELSEIVIRTLTLSSFAEATQGVGDTLDFNDDILIDVTAEDGTVTSWTVLGEVAGSEPQLPNSDFEVWYQTPGGYFEPGENADNTIWGTGNPGTHLIGVLTVTPEEDSDENTITRMVTKYNGAIPAAFGTPISAGSIFVGKFNSDNIDPNNPRAAIDFGTPFTARPTAFTLDYRYSPGEMNQDKNEDPLPYSDNCDIYVLLEVRDGDFIKRLGTAWFRSDAEVSEITNLEVPVTYGPLDSSFPDFMRPPNGVYVSVDSAQFILPTHLTFVASSSFDGDNFAGAVGSTLEIDNLFLKYD